MLIQNLRLNFKKEALRSGTQGDEKTLVFETENGMEVILPKFLLEDHPDYQSGIFLSADRNVMPTSEDYKKDILNEFIGNEE